MNKETFISLMQTRDWTYEGRPQTENTEFHSSSSKSLDLAQDDGVSQFRRSNSIIFIKDCEIFDLIESEFYNFFFNRTSIFHFKDDWMKEFKGSEFLIPVVDNELRHVKSI